MRKKILFLYNKEHEKDYNARLHFDWIYDYEVRKAFDIQLWGKGYNEDLSVQGLKKVLNVFKPDYLYGTIWKRYFNGVQGAWLPDLTNVRIPKIFVEVDTGDECKRRCPFYIQWSKVLCRNVFSDNIAGWEGTPIFRWSIPRVDILDTCNSLRDRMRNGIKMICSFKKYYPERIWIKNTYQQIICKTVFDEDEYYRELQTAEALVCPGTSTRGEYMPAKFLEYLSSGAAVITNIKESLIRSMYPEVSGLYLPYEKPELLQPYFSLDFSKWCGAAFAGLMEHRHVVRFKEIFV
jgi:hypothetical protein